jgi:tetratricopeptide (TPR) repeat protein
MSSSPHPSAAQYPHGGSPSNADELLDKGPDSAGKWIAEIAAAAAVNWGLPDLRSKVTQLTWQARRLGHLIPLHHPFHGDPGLPGLVALYICGQRYRFDFNFCRLDEYLDAHKNSAHAEDALVQSFHAFADLGLARNSDAVSRLNHVLSLTDADTRVRQVCLAGLWAAYRLPDQSDRLLNLANKMVALGEADGTVYFRRAAAHRMLGRHEEALVDIDYALSLLAPGNNDINQDYLRERQLIGLVMRSSAAR